MLIEIENLVKRYGDFTALNHLNLSVKKERYWDCLVQMARQIHYYQLYSFIIDL